MKKSVSLYNQPLPDGSSVYICLEQNPGADRYARFKPGFVPGVDGVPECRLVKGCGDDVVIRQVQVLRAGLQQIGVL